jgi:hypothetical protein
VRDGYRSVLAEVADGIRSTAEGDLRDLIKAARLPTPLFNPSLYAGDTFIAKPDAWWPDAGVSAEVDSRQWHLSPEAWERTMNRHDLMGEFGIIPLHFSPRKIRHEPTEVIQRIKGALENGLKRPPLPIRTIPCPAARADRVNECGGLPERAITVVTFIGSWLPLRPARARARRHVGNKGRLGRGGLAARAGRTRGADSRRGRGWGEERSALD